MAWRFFITLGMIVALGLSLTRGALADAAPQDPMPATHLHRMIVSQTGWLNTSRPLTADDLAGRVILLDFWTYCCINCMHIIPDLNYLEEKFGDRLTVIGIHSAKFKNERDSENIRQAILRYGLHHPVVNDFDFSLWKDFGIHAWPTFVLINPRGLLEATYSGEGNREKAAHDIEKLMAQYDGQIVTKPLPIALEQDKQPPSILSFPSKLIYVPDFRGQPVLMISDSGHNRIVVMGLDGKIILSVGDGQPGWKDGFAKEARFNHPQGLVYRQGFLYVADTENHLLRLIDFGVGDEAHDTRVDSASGAVVTLAGTGQQGHERAPQNAPALKTPLSSPWDLAFDKGGLVIAMAGTHQLWRYDAEKKTVSVIAGNGNESIEDGAYPDNSLAQTSGLSRVGDKLYFVDAETSSLRVLENGEIETLIGSGLFDFGYKEGDHTEARMQHPLGLYADRSDAVANIYNHPVFIADSYNHSIRSYNPATGFLSNLIGHGVRGHVDGAFAEASFNEPNAIVRGGNKLYIADTNNNAIRIADLDSKTVSTLNVTEPVQSTAPEFSDALPNVDNAAAIAMAAHVPVNVTLALAAGWHINSDAPSYLALFDMSGTPKITASFDRDAVKSQHMLLSGIGAPGAYRLQGTLYYCQDKAGAQCLIQSFDIPLTVKSGGEKEITLKLKTKQVSGIPSEKR